MSRSVQKTHFWAPLGDGFTLLKLFLLEMTWNLQIFKRGMIVYLGDVFNVVLHFGWISIILC